MKKFTSAFGRLFLSAVLIFLVFYTMMPAINLHDQDFIVFLIICILIVLAVNFMESILIFLKTVQQNLLRFCHAHGYKFYAAAIYCVTKALGRIENFRMFKNADGELCVWDKIVPNFTFFHPDDCTFSDCWTDFSEDFPTFYNAITADMQTYKDVKGIKTKPNQPANFYCVSCTPWTAFTGCGSRVADGQPAYFPIVVMGRYEKCGGKVNMPVNITIAHAVADGYHAGLFFRYLQEELDSLR